MHDVAKVFNDEKGFGFINQNDGGPDLFVHRTVVSGEALMEGMRLPRLLTPPTSDSTRT